MLGKSILVFIAVGSAACASAGSRALVSVDPYVTVQQISADARGFAVRDIVPVKVPTAVRPGDECLASDEYAGHCDGPTYSNYRDAYRVYVSYDSQATNLASDEYPRGRHWSADFVVPASTLDASAVARARSLDSSSLPAALQRLVSVEPTTLSVARPVLLAACPSTLVWETEWRRDDPSCRDQVSTRETTVPALRIVPHR